MHTATISGTYGSQLTPCQVFVYGPWYAVEGSRNVNQAADGGALVEGVDVETLADVDSFTWPDGIHSLADLVEAIDD